MTERYCSVCGGLLFFDEKDVGKCLKCQIREKDAALASRDEEIGRLRDLLSRVVGGTGEGWEDEDGNSLAKEIDAILATTKGATIADGSNIRKLYDEIARLNSSITAEKSMRKDASDRAETLQEEVERLTRERDLFIKSAKKLLKERDEAESAVSRYEGKVQELERSLDKALEALREARAIFAASCMPPERLIAKIDAALGQEVKP